MTEPEVLRGVIISLTVSAETVDDLLDALMWVSHTKYAESSRYWHRHLSSLRGGDHQMAIPFASFMSLAAAVLACDIDEYIPREWLRAQLAGVMAAIEHLAPAAAADVRSVVRHPGLNGSLFVLSLRDPHGNSRRV